MGGSIRKLLEAIESVSSVEDVDQLQRLQEVAEQYFASPEAADRLAVWFRPYERFPEHDACGIFWTILHGLEAQPGCDVLVLESVRRRPTRFPVRMINRMLNAGQTKVGEVDL